MVKSAERVIQILDFVKESKEGISQKDFITGLGIPKSSMSALLSTLLASEYLSYDPVSRRYKLGPGIVSIVGRYLANLDIVRIAEPIIRQIAATLDESAELAVRKGRDIQIIFNVNCLRPLQRVTDFGSCTSLHIAAAGKAILAHLSEEEIEDYLSTADMSPVTAKTNTDTEVTRHELQEIREGGIAYCFEERCIGIIALASPVFDVYGQVKGAIVVPIPSIRFDKKKAKEVEQLLKYASINLSHQLGHTAEI